MSIDFYPGKEDTREDGTRTLSPVMRWSALEELGAIINLANGNAYALAESIGWQIDGGCMDVPLADAIEDLNRFKNNGCCNDPQFENYAKRLTRILEVAQNYGATHLVGC